MLVQMIHANTLDVVERGVQWYSAECCPRSSGSRFLGWALDLLKGEDIFKIAAHAFATLCRNKRAKKADHGVSLRFWNIQIFEVANKS